MLVWYADMPDAVFQSVFLGWRARLGCDDGNGDGGDSWLGLWCMLHA